MTLGSLFDGVGTWQKAAVNVGIEPVWASEIDNFACSVSKRHFPNTIQLGNINNIVDAPKVDIITASSPCQDLSVAGKQGGIFGERSGLFFRATEIVRRINPEFFVWENVTGALSSNRGLDFKTVLEEISQTKIPIPERGWARAGLVDCRRGQIAWRVLDAQFFGVPQRRKRIFLVADFAGRRAAKILFESDGVSGNSAPCQSEKSTAAARIGRNSDVAVKNPLVAYGIDRAAFNQGVNAKYKPQITPEMAMTLTARGASAVATSSFVRKLTPVECERLMGLPDGWTAGGSDAARYKALGNAVVLPVVEWILGRIAEVETC